MQAQTIQNFLLTAITLSLLYLFLKALYSETMSLMLSNSHLFELSLNILVKGLTSISKQNWNKDESWLSVLQNTLM